MKKNQKMSPSIKIKREKNKRHQLARLKYLSPESDTFLKKGKSLKAVGYSEDYAEHKGSILTDSGSITEFELLKLEPFISQFPQILSNLQKKLDLIGSSKNITAKDYTALLRHTELIAKCAGIIKERIETKSVNVNIDIPISKCPKCGYIMDIMAEEQGDE